MKELLIMIAPIWASATCVAAYYWGYSRGRKQGHTEIPQRRKPQAEREVVESSQSAGND